LAQNPALPISPEEFNFEFTKVLGRINDHFAAENGIIYTCITGIPIPRIGIKIVIVITSGS
jgi:hypothetical protein